MPAPAECHLCPRACGADRAAGVRGRCGADGEIRIALADLHHWEEPPISGAGGAGAVFFSGCPLGCVFCQNHAISRGPAGRSISAAELADVFLGLAQRGAETLDLVTGTAYVPSIVEAVAAARQRGMHLPVVWNSSAFETADTLRQLEGTVDIYLPDFKYWSDEAARRYANAPGYRRTAKHALAEMVRQRPRCRTEAGVLQSGVVVRHLLLPGGLHEARCILRYLNRAFGESVWVSLMRQYTPIPGLADYPELQSRVADTEYRQLVREAADLRFDVVFTQEEGCASLYYVPDFGS